MEYKKVHALYRGHKENEGGFLPGWGYDLRIADNGDNISVEYMNNDVLPELLKKEDFQKRWKIVRTLA